MATSNKKSLTAYFTLENVFDTVSLVNFTALNATEKGVMKGLAFWKKAQDVSSKNIKKGLEFSATKQEVLFDSLETSKGKIISFINKK